MKKPEIPHDEQARLLALRSLSILDTPVEDRFDRITRLATRVFHVPVALISLIDENRQWFKSCQGISLSETPRDISFCGHAILSNEVLVIPDAAKDERFADNPLVINEPKIRFYAGCPLRHIDGSKLGTLCVIDTTPRNFSHDDIEALKDLAELVEHELIAIELATTDELTNIYNRRGFITVGQEILNLCNRQNIPTSIALIDLNEFKAINDRFGHAEGDRALVQLAKQMKDTFRVCDVVARLGGDEFVLLLSNTSAESAKLAIKRLMDSLERYNRYANNGYDILFSYGVVSTELGQLESIESLLAKADSLMFKQKNNSKLKVSTQNS